jgi:hypothetical protein
MYYNEPTFRYFASATSNNKTDSNKNICVLAIAKHLGVDQMSTYFHNSLDLIDATKTLHDVSNIIEPVRVCVGNLPNLIQFVKIAEIKPLIGAIVHVHKHVILVDSDGYALVDTNPWDKALLWPFFQKDRRKVLGVTLIFKR